MASARASLTTGFRRLLSSPDAKPTADETEALLEAGRLAQTLVREFEAQGGGWFWHTDREGAITYLSAKVADAVLPGSGGALGVPVAQLFRSDSGASGQERTLPFHLTSRTGFAELAVCSHEGALERWWSMSGRPVFDAAGDFCGFVGSGADLTEKRRAAAEITRLALFDGLTGLANRQRMRATLEQTLVQSRLSYRATALLLLDLDRFKAVNDTLGHQTGDALLQQVAQRLTECVGDAGLVGRLGGDEFKVIVPNEGNEAMIGALARRIIDALSLPYSLAGTSVTIGCSIGVAIAPVDGDDPDVLVRNADLALYAAKADGRGLHRVYRPEMLSSAQNRRQLEDDLRVALGEDQLTIAYQPVVCLADGRISGYEALLRWNHPMHGAVSPADFIPIAEDCGLIEPLGEWVLRTAIAEAASWPHDVRVAVNVSPIQFANPALPTIVLGALAAAGMEAPRLELEITESVFLTDSTASEDMFKRLKSLGVRLALDDFGTGYSSLGYLRNAPFDKIKIDQSFVRGATVPGNRNAALIEAIVRMAGALGMETTAEGVEVQDEIELIRQLGCSHVQGYVYGRPMSAADARALLAQQGHIVAIGHRITRAPRLRVLRRARVAMGRHETEVRIRNISRGGALIDGLATLLAIDTPLRIEVTEGILSPARVRWCREGQAGIAFDDPIDLNDFTAAATRAA